MVHQCNRAETLNLHFPGDQLTLSTSHPLLKGRETLRPSDNALQSPMVDLHMHTLYRVYSKAEDALSFNFSTAAEPFITELISFVLGELRVELNLDNTN